MFFVDKLIGMGARIVLCDPHRAVVVGPVAAARRHGRVARHPRRHGDAARGALRRRATSTINNVGQIERGYERIDERLRALGAQIERVEDRRAVRWPASIDATSEAIVDDFARASAFAPSRPRARGQLRPRIATSRSARSWRGGRRCAASSRRRRTARDRAPGARHARGRARRRVGGLARGDEADGHLAPRPGTALAVTSPTACRSSSLTRRAPWRCCIPAGGARRRASSSAAIAALAQRGFARRRARASTSARRSAAAATR